MYVFPSFQLFPAKCQKLRLLLRCFKKNTSSFVPASYHDLLELGLSSWIEKNVSTQRKPWNRETVKSLNPKICRGKIVGNADSMWAHEKKNLITFHYTDCLIGIPIMGYNKPYNKGVVQTPVYNLNNQVFFSLLMFTAVWTWHKDTATLQFFFSPPPPLLEPQVSQQASQQASALLGVLPPVLPLWAASENIQVKKKNIVPTVQENVSKFF